MTFPNDKAPFEARRYEALLGACLALTLLNAACASEGAETDTSNRGGGSTSGGGGTTRGGGSSGRGGADDDAGAASDAGASGEEHVYALQTTVYQPDESVLSYVALTSTLELQGVLSLEGTREFPGYAFISAVGDKLLVSSGESPEIRQYSIGSAHEWREIGRLSFANLGVPSFGAGMERHSFLNEHVAYLTLEVTSRVVWDPTQMLILGVRDDTLIEPKLEGLVADAAFNRPPLALEGPVLKPFYYRDDDWFHFGATTKVATYDPVTHVERSVLDVPCPGLEVLSQDERGNTYLSPWTYGPALSLFGEGPPTCVRRVKSDGTLDETWTPELSAWTGGRPVQVLRYVGDGEALATVLHVDEVNGDFSSGYDEDLATELDSHWKLWELDLSAEKAHRVEEIAAIGSGFSLAKLDGRTFVFVPNEDWTTTTVFELGADGHALERFTVPGILNNWVKLR